MKRNFSNFVNCFATYMTAQLCLLHQQLLLIMILSWLKFAQWWRAPSYHRLPSKTIDCAQFISCCRGLGGTILFLWCTPHMQPPPLSSNHTPLLDYNIVDSEISKLIINYLIKKLYIVSFTLEDIFECFQLGVYLDNTLFYLHIWYYCPIHVTKQDFEIRYYLKS